MYGRLKISEVLTASELRAWARHCGHGRAAARAYAIANALDGLAGPKRPGLPGWSVRRCEMRLRSPTHPPLRMAGRWRHGWD